MAETMDEKSALCGGSVERDESWSEISDCSGVLPRLTSMEMETPSVPTPASARAANATSPRRRAGRTLVPVAMSVTLATTTSEASTPSRLAKPVVMAVMTARWPITSLMRRIVPVGTMAKRQRSSTSGTLVGDGLWLGVELTDTVLEGEGVRERLGVLVSEGEAERLAVLVVEMVGVRLAVLVVEAVTEAAAVGVDEGGRMHVPEGASK